MIRIVQIIAIFVLILAFAVCNNIFFKKYKNKAFVLTQVDESIVIVEVLGSNEFIDQTITALNLLEEYAPDALRKVQKYVGTIEQGKHSAMWAYEEPPRFEVHDTTAFSSDTWYAGSIAHDATHSELFHEYQANNNAKVPDKVWKERDAELICIQYQLDVLKRLGAPQREIANFTVNSPDGTHCDIDKDGDCDWLDYWRRNW